MAGNGFKQQTLTRIAIERNRLGDSVEEARRYANNIGRRLNRKHCVGHLKKLRELSTPEEKEAFDGKQVR